MGNPEDRALSLVQVFTASFSMPMMRVGPYHQQILWLEAFHPFR